MPDKLEELKKKIEHYYFKYKKMKIKEVTTDRSEKYGSKHKCKHEMKITFYDK